MERDPVLLTVSKLDNSYPRGIDNMAMKPVELPVLDLPIRDFTRLSVEPADDQRSIASSIDSRNSGSRNFENIKVEWRNLTFKVKKGKGQSTHRTKNDHVGAFHNLLSPKKSFPRNTNHQTL